jgi:hypothetical protein
MKFDSARTTAHPAVGDFTWKRLGNPRFTAGQIADKGRRATRRLKEWGVSVPHNCRLVRATELIEKVASDAEGLRSLSDDGRNRVGEAARAVFDFYIATHGKNVKPPDLVLHKFEQAIGGSEMIADEKSHPERDTQFELYVWGMLNASGTNCSFHEPPDLICGYGDETVGVAVKRVWSPDQTKKRFSKAGEQIEDTKFRGLIAVNTHEFLSAEEGAPDLEENGNDFNRDVARLHGHLPDLALKPHVLGLLLCGATFRFAAADFIDVSVYHQILIMTTENSADEQFAEGFNQARFLGLADWLALNL